MAAALSATKIQLVRHRLLLPVSAATTATTPSSLRMASMASMTSVAIATAIVAGLGGYFVGQASMLGGGITRGGAEEEEISATPLGASNGDGGEARASSSSSSSSSSLSPSWWKGKDDDHDEEETLGGGSSVVNSSRKRREEDESVGDDSARIVETDTSAMEKLGDRREEMRLMLVVRTDLGMSRGKMAAQCSHATLACYKAMLRSPTPAAQAILRRWERYGQTKIAVQVRGEDDLLMLQARAARLGLMAQIIHDAGRTQIAAGSATVLGVGPGPKSIVDQVTGHLKLL